MTALGTGWHALMADRDRLRAALEKIAQEAEACSDWHATDGSGQAVADIRWLRDMALAALAYIPAGQPRGHTPVQITLDEVTGHWEGR